MRGLTYQVTLLFVLTVTFVFWGACTGPNSGKPCQTDSDCPQHHTCVIELTRCIAVLGTKDRDSGFSKDSGINQDDSTSKDSGGGTTPPIKTCKTGHACQIGQSKCTASGLLSNCVTNPTTGCQAWGPGVVCPAQGQCIGNSCTGGNTGSDAGTSNDSGTSTDTGSGSCKNLCAVGTRRCLGQKIQGCQMESNGCSNWSQAVSCPSGRICLHKKCSIDPGAGPSCKNKCPIHTQKCSGSRIDSCRKQSNGCFDWQAGTTCSGGKTCVVKDGSASCSSSSSCTNKCTANAQKCSGNRIDSCVKQSNGCYDWRAGTACPSGQACVAQGSSASCQATGPQANCGMNQLEQDVLALTNKERAAKSVAALKCNSKLAAAARFWSQEQCKRGKISHDGFSKRLRDTGLRAYGGGENVAAGQRTAQGVMRSWMNSSGHRRNILTSSFTHLGVGFANCSNGRYRQYWTQIFARLR